MVEREAGRVIFDGVASLYDEARPHYPDALIADVISLSSIPSGGRILEVGCGTGQATRAFAERGYSMLCLEPGANLASLARSNLQAYPKVGIEVVTFEDWPLQENAFDLVVFADCFRWVDPGVGYAKSAAALRESGAVAIFRNASPPVDSEFFRELDMIYVKHTPQELAARSARSPAEAADGREQEMRRTGLFAEVMVRRYPWSIRYDAVSYTKLLNTYSGHLSLDKATRHSLLSAIADLIERHGGVFTKPYLAVLHLARKHTG